MGCCRTCDPISSLLGMDNLIACSDMCYVYTSLCNHAICSAIWGLLDKDDDLRANHEVLNTERIL